jgi:hypothetical protein
LGFLNPNQPLTPLIFYAILASFFGSAGYTLCLLFYSPLVTCNAYLVEPLLAQALGYICGLDKLPGFMTAIGTVFAIYGIMYIDKGSRERKAVDDTKIDLGLEDSRGALDLTNIGGISGLDTSKLDDSSLSDLNMSHLSGR